MNLPADPSMTKAQFAQFSSNACAADTSYPVVFAEGDVVRVRDEEMLSIVALPTDRPSTCELDGIPDVHICCVPIALVRTPVDDGVLRWVEIRDLTRAERELETDDSDSAAPLTLELGTPTTNRAVTATDEIERPPQECR